MQKTEWVNPIDVLAESIMTIWVRGGQARQDSSDARRYSRDLAAQIIHEMNKKGHYLRVSPYHARTVSLVVEAPRPQKGVFKDSPQILARRSREKERERLRAPASAPLSSKR